MTCGASWETLTTTTSVVSSDAVWSGDVVSTVRMKNQVPVLQFHFLPSLLSPRTRLWCSGPAQLSPWSGGAGHGSSTAITGVRVLSFQVGPFHVLPYHQPVPTSSTTWDVLVFLTDSFLPDSFIVSGSKTLRLTSKSRFAVCRAVPG